MCIRDRYKCLFLNKAPCVESGNLESYRPKVTNMKKLQDFPCLWKTRNIILIYKSKKPSTLSGSYCVISLVQSWRYSNILLAPSGGQHHQQGAIRVLSGHLTTLKIVRFVIHQVTPPTGINPCCPVGHDQTFNTSTESRMETCSRDCLTHTYQCSLCISCGQI